APQTRAYAHPLASLAQTLGISAADIADTPLWVNTGNEQLVTPLASADAVRRCRPDAARMAGEKAADDTTKIYVWADLGGGELLVRFFLLKHGTLSEDHGTGSAAANLGGWYVARKVPLPVKRAIRQGEPINRPAKLALNVDADGSIYVGGRVIELGQGVVML
ncbi:MAG TPA: PhzF family phenazine biosynthesis protein, partial [Burkholderiales bacterium]|nr:PhzF family phenazine biosynthesis protein [Burkholderiales bacterium]